MVKLQTADPAMLFSGVEKAAYTIDSDLTKWMDWISLK